MKRVLIITALLALTFLITLGAWSAHEERGDEALLEDEVAEEILELRMKSSLLQELGWDAATIDVEVAGGEVILSGVVDKPATRKMAKQIAKSFDEIHSVTNKVEVEENTAETPIASAVGGAEEGFKNAVLETRVKTRLVSELGRYGLHVQVEAADGVVSLRGEVPDEERREIALEAVRECKGVEKVIDLLEIQGA